MGPRHDFRVVPPRVRRCQQNSRDHGTDNCHRRSRDWVGPSTPYKFIWHHGTPAKAHGGRRFQNPTLVDRKFQSPTEGLEIFLSPTELTEIFLSPHRPSPATGPTQHGK